jgi:excisionase family DNA binding protein
MARDFMTIEEAAEYLRFSHTKLKDMVARRQIPHVPSEGEIRFRKIELDMWLSQFIDEEYLEGDEDD